MVKVAALIFLCCFALILSGCPEKPPADPQEPDKPETPGITPELSKEPAPAPTPSPEPKPAPQPDPPEKETPGEPPPAEPTKPDSGNGSNDVNIVIGPVLPDTLNRNCQITQGSEDFDNTGLAIGETAIDFSLKDTTGNEFRLSHLLAEKPVMMAFGSFT